jgi:hypothetical protein
MALKVKRLEEKCILEEVFMGLLGYKSIPRWMALFSCAILFTVLLAACGGGGGSTTSTPTPTPTTAAKASPTTPPTMTPVTSSTTYTGNGFSVSYPTGWQAMTAKKSEVDFVDPTGNYAFTVVFAPDPSGLATPDILMTAEINALKASIKNPQAANVPSPVTVGGDKWLQKSLTGQVSVGGQNVPGQVIVLVDVHPAHAATSMSYSILLSGPSAAFDTTNASDFQPMLQSFKFTS